MGQQRPGPRRAAHGSSTTARCSGWPRSTTSFVAPDPLPGHHGAPLPPLPPSEPGHPHRCAHHRPAGGVDQPALPRAHPGAARLGRLRPHPAHRRGRGPRLHPHHPVREHRRRRSALHALLRARRRGSRGRLHGDGPAHGQVLRGVAHRGVRACGPTGRRPAGRWSTATPSASSAASPRRRRRPAPGADRPWASSWSTSRARTSR